MDDKNLIEFLKQRNNQLIDELSEKICENQILLLMKIMLESILEKCYCDNPMKEEILKNTLELMRQHNILVDINTKNKGII